MIRPRAARLRVTLIVALISLGWAAVAYSAGDRSFGGKTSQQQGISFRIAGGSLRKLQYRIVDRCPKMMALINHDFGFPPVRIRHSRFAGTFFDHAHDGKAVIEGRVSRQVVTGSLSDRTKSTRTHMICTGRASFRLHAS